MRMALILAGLILSLAAQPQQIYRWVDEDGIVHYSDKPGAPNAERLHLEGTNAYEAIPAADEYAATAEEPSSFAIYDSLAIVQPEQDQVFFGADASVTVAVELGGTLRSDHTLVFFLNGNRVPAEDGASAQLSNLERGTHFLRAAVLDQNGAPVISSQQITFHVRQPSVQNPQSQVRLPRPQPRPTTPAS